MGIFSTRGEKYYFMRGEIEMNIGKLGTRKNSNFFFGWRGALVGVGVTQGGLHKVDLTRGGLCEVGLT